MTKCHECVGNEAGLRRVRIVVGVAVGDTAEIFERLEIVLRDAITFGVHATELPLRNRVTFFGGIFERVHRLDGFAGLEPVRAGTERFHRRHRRRTHSAIGLAAVERMRRRRGQQAAEQQDAEDALRCPHNTLSRPHRPDASPRR